MNRKSVLISSNIFFILTFLLSLLCSCGGATARPQLELAETLMDARPDSSLQILDSIDASRLRGGDRALYALLLTQARDKNYLDLSNDSIINEAVDYYGREGDAEKLGLAHYYRGRVMYDRSDFPAAIVDFMESKKMSDRTGNYFIGGMSCRGLCDIYCETYHSDDELYYATKCYEYMQKSGRKSYELDALNDLGRANYNTGRIDEAIEIVGRLREEGSGDERLQRNVSHLYALCLQEKKRYEEGLPLWDRLMEGPYVTNLDSMRRCDVLLETGNLSEAERFLSEIRDDRSAMRSYLQTKLCRLKGDIQGAFANLSVYDSRIQTVMSESRKQKLPTVLGDYNEKNTKEYLSDIHITRMWNILLICVLFLLSLVGGGLIWLIVYRHRRRLRENLEKYTRLAELKSDLERDYELLHSSQEQIASELQSSKTDLSWSNAELSRLEEERKKLDSKTALLKSYLADIMSQRLRILCKALPPVETGTAGDFSEHENRSEWKQELDSFLKEFEMTEKELALMENYINLAYDGVMSRFRSVVSLKESDYHVMLLSLLDIPCGRIAGLLGIGGVSNVYIRRKHIQKRIRLHFSASEGEMYIKWMQRGIIKSY